MDNFTSGRTIRPLVRELYQSWLHERPILAWQTLTNGLRAAIRSGAGGRSGGAGAVPFRKILGVRDGLYDFWITSVVGYVDDNLGRRRRQGLALGAGNLVLAHVAAILGLGLKVELDRIRVAVPDVFNERSFGQVFDFFHGLADCLSEYRMFTDPMLNVLARA